MYFSSNRVRVGKDKLFLNSRNNLLMAAALSQTAGS